MEELKYPVGRFVAPVSVSAAERAEMIQLLEDTPARLRRAVEGLVEGQLETPYRPGGWTVRQVVHHVPDSHINAYVRFRLALTESTPAIKTYEEHLWAELPDARTAPLEISLPLLEALHRRWTLMLRALDEAQWKRPFRHPEMGEMALEQSLAHYAWHSRHHVAHITRLRERLGWV